MPRNLNKTPCQVPGCRSWAMRGHTHCRAHRDDELGPRGAGAPSGNLNALKHGHHAQPLPLPDVKHLARQIIEQEGTPDEIRNTANPVVRQFINGLTKGPRTDKSPEVCTQ